MRIRTLTLPILCFVAAIHSSCGLAREPIDKLIQKLDAIREDNNVAAYSLVIVSADEVLHSGHHGTRSLSNDTPIGQEAYFRLGSITKSFVGLSAAIAEERGLIDLNTPITTIIGKNYFRNSYSTPVTLAQLLEHTAGFPDMTSGKEFNYNEPVDDETGLKLFAAQRQVQWQPGLYSSYSNSGYGLAGLTLTKALERDIESWLKESLFKPLNMNSATLQKSAKVAAHLVPGFNRDGRTPIPYWHTIFPSFGAMNIQPREMANFLQMLLQHGHFNGKQIIAKRVIERFETPKTPLSAQMGIRYGYGLGIYSWLRNGHLFHGHGGDADGYLARYAYQRDAEMGYFIVINAFQNSTLRSMQRAIEDWMISELEPATPDKEMALDNLERYEGNYQAITQRFGRGQSTLKLFVRDNQLFSQLPNQRAYRLVPVGPNQFRYPNETLPTLTIVDTDQGMVFSGDDGNFLRSRK